MYKIGDVIRVTKESDEHNAFSVGSVLLVVEVFSDALACIGHSKYDIDSLSNWLVDIDCVVPANKLIFITDNLI